MELSRPEGKLQIFVSFIDFAPTFLELAEVDQDTIPMQRIEGKSLGDILYSEKSGTVTEYRDHVLIGKERHDVGRENDWGYPIRGIRKGDYLLVINFENNRWPSGNPITGYLNCDGGATKTQILNDRRETGKDKYWDYCFGKRPEREFYNVTVDPVCVNNLVNDEKYATLIVDMEIQLLKELKRQGDPRMEGKGFLFDNYLYANKNDRNFYTRFVNGENPKAGWVNKTDFEPVEGLYSIDDCK